MHAYTDHSDEDLIRLLAEDNERAFEALYERYSVVLFRYAAARLDTTEDAEEIVQSVFIRVWEKRQRLQHVINLKAYLYSVCRNMILDHIAHVKVKDRYAQHYILNEVAAINSTEQQFDAAELQELIEDRIRSLPDRQQQAFRLSRFEHQSIKDIADRMQLSTGTVENYITNVLNHLREVLGNQYKIH